MRRKIAARASAIGPLIVFAFVALSCRGSAPAAVELAADTHPVLFYDEATFFSSVRAAEVLPAPPGAIAGAIVPHDWRGGQYITWLFQSIAARPPDTIVLIGPNHDNEGYPGVLTSVQPWSTPFGVVQPDRDQIGKFIEADQAFVDETVLSTEHSVAGLMPAIAYYLPRARVVPLIIRGDAGPEAARRLGEVVAAQITDSALVVAAVDFSHDLISSASQRSNSVTLDALRAGDTATLFTLDNTYLDSPESIAALIAAMSSLDAGPFALTANTNSAALRGDDLAPTTSYLVGYYAAPAAGSSASRHHPRTP